MYQALVSYYLKGFQERGENALQSICNCVVPSHVILVEYRKLPPIEKLPEKEKKDLWEYSKEMYPKGDKETRLRFIKIVYTIGTLL